MQVTIIGSVNFDRIVTADGVEKSSLGGILYNVLSLAPLLSPESTIVPLIRVGREHWDEVVQLLQKCPNVDSRGAKMTDTGTNENLVTYVSETERSERLTLRTPPFTVEEAEPYLHADLVLFNFITGSEIGLSLLERAGSDAGTTVYVDIHSKVLGMREDGSRYPDGWTDWRDWLKHADIVQMNIDECRLLLKEGLEAAEDLHSAARRIGEAGPSQVIITLGSLGSLVYWRREGEHSQLVPASADVHRVVDTTGCGDCFTAGYIWGLVKYEDPLRAACAANVIAGEHCRSVGLTEGLSSNEIGKRVISLYPEIFRE